MRNMDRFEGLLRGWHSIVGLDPEPTLSFYDFVAAVEVYEKYTFEAGLERQYEQEIAK